MIEVFVIKHLKPFIDKYFFHFNARQFIIPFVSIHVAKPNCHSDYEIFRNLKAIKILKCKQVLDLFIV